MSNPLGVILAAGAAIRIRPLSEHIAKPLLPICNEPIIVHQLAALKDAGVEDAIVVVGDMREQFTGLLGDGSRLGMSITYVEQRQPLGIAHALARVTPLIDRPFFVCLGDIFSCFSPGRGLADLIAVQQREGASAVLTVKEEPDEAAIRRNFAVEEQGGRVTRVVEKPRGPLRTSLRGCGLYFFDTVALEAVARTPRSALRDEYEITDSIAILVDSGAPVHCTTLIDWDANITFPSDLLECNLRRMRAMGVDSIVSKRASVHHACEISNCVLGDDVRIDAPIRLSESVILPGAHIASAADITRCIVGPEAVVECA